MSESIEHEGGSLLDGEFFYTNQGTKNFSSLTDLCNWLLLIQPKHIQVVSGNEQSTGEFVYQLQWVRNE